MAWQHVSKRPVVAVSLIMLSASSGSVSSGFCHPLLFLLLLSLPLFCVCVCARARACVHVIITIIVAFVVILKIITLFVSPYLTICL